MGTWSADGNGIFQYSTQPAGDSAEALATNASVISALITALKGEFAALGTASAANVGVAAHDVVQLDASAKLPAVDGSQLTGIASGSVSAVTNGNGLTLTGGTLAFSGAGYDASGSASAVNTALATHEGMTGPAVHGLGTASTHAAGDFATPASVATALGSYLPLAGGTLTGQIVSSATGEPAITTASGGYGGITFLDPVTSDNWIIGAGTGGGSLLGFYDTVSSVVALRLSSAGDMTIAGSITFPDTTVQATAWTGTVTGYLPLVGGTMSGALNMGQSAISNVGGITTSWSGGAGTALDCAGGSVANASALILNSGGAIAFGDSTIQTTAYAGAPSLSTVLTTGSDAGSGTISSLSSLSFSMGGTITGLSSAGLQLTDGFNGSGNYTNFTIANGIITAAS